MHVSNGQFAPIRKKLSTTQPITDRASTISATMASRLVQNATSPISRLFSGSPVRDRIWRVK